MAATILLAGWGLWHLRPAGGLAAGPPALPSPVLSASPSPPAKPVLGLDRQAPSKIVIKKISLSATLETVGMSANGTVEEPPLSKYDRAFWYRNGPGPGEVGPAVILGHVDTKDHLGVFFYLSKLRPGDQVEVERRDKSTVVFTVTSVEEFPKTNFPTQRVYGHTDEPTLRLITCGGTFDRHTGHYLDNVIVFATMTGSRPPSL
jgi:hypothetical protein